MPSRVAISRFMHPSLINEATSLYNQERYVDALGRYRDMEAGRTVDATGSLDGQAFTDAKGLAQLLSQDPRVARCLSRTLYRQAAGHVEAREEGRPLKVLEDSFSSSGFRMKALMLAIAESDALTTARRPAGVTP